MGGHFNAHLHLDRAGTYQATVELLQGTDISNGAALPIAAKHSLIHLIHDSSCYDPPQLASRLVPYLERMVACGTRRADTVIDVTTDRVGLSALQTFNELKQRFKDRMDLRIGAYSPFGFRDDEPERWSLLTQGAEQSDFIGLLPERDGKELYPDHIGFYESCRRAILLAHQMGKNIHIHTDQANHCDQSETELIASLVDEIGLATDRDTEPFIWLIHVISPSTYDEPRFVALAQKIAEMNIGLICCPSAAISMRQYRSIHSPTYNCIARVLEFLAAGVWVRLGSDNVCDITSPMGTDDLMDEVAVLGNAIRFYDEGVLARIAAGQRLSVPEIARVKAHLALDAEFVEAFTYSVERGRGAKL